MVFFDALRINIRKDGVIKKMAQENPKKIIEIGNEKKPRMLPTNIWGVSMVAIFYGFFATAAGICMLLAVALKFNGGISSLAGAAAALIAVLLINSQYPKRLRSELIEGNVISEDTQTYQGEERRKGSISAKDKGDILCYGGVLLAFLIYGQSAVLSKGYERKKQSFIGT